MIQVNRKRMEALLQDFYTLTSIRIVLFDNEQRELLSYPPRHCDFCRRMRKTPQFNKKCVLSDRAAFARSRTSAAPIVYTCHAGLTEAVIHISDGGTILGYIMFGQVIPQETAEKTLRMLSQACLALGDDELLHTVGTMASKTNAQIQAAATILDALSVYLWTNRLVALPKATFIHSLNDYVDQHLTDNILADDLCAFFGIGRTHLYKLASQYLECSVSSYIRKRRILRAKSLLRNTKFPVTEIAAMTGFNEYNYFSKIFRQETGTTARKFRQANNLIDLRQIPEDEGD